MCGVKSDPKKYRLKDEKAIEYVKTLSCCACGTWGVDAHHLISRGAGGPDSISNLLPLCRIHHSEIHQIGVTKMCDKYSGVFKYIQGVKK